MHAIWHPVWADNLLNCIWNNLYCVELESMIGNFQYVFPPSAPSLLHMFTLQEGLTGTAADPIFITLCLWVVNWISLTLGYRILYSWIVSIARKLAMHSIFLTAWWNCFCTKITALHS